ncbi:uncharacterized protein LOC144463882 [Epinephelus lanceolatus]
MPERWDQQVSVEHLISERQHYEEDVNTFLESHVDVDYERPSTSNTHQGVSSANNEEGTAGHAQGDSGVAAHVVPPGPTNSDEDSCDEGPLSSRTHQDVSSADNEEGTAGHTQDGNGVAASFGRPGPNDISQSRITGPTQPHLKIYPRTIQSNQVRAVVKSELYAHRACGRPL